jgi:3-phenylpropionate/cinnamic acid dioxygenase small subunit
VGSAAPIGDTVGPVEHGEGFLTDRREIDDLLVRYASVIDGRRWDEFETVFTPDAVLDYRSAGGIRGPLAEVGQWLATVIPYFTWTQHLIVNRAVRLTTGAHDATAHSSFYNPNGAQVDATPWLFVVGGAYHDRLVRTPEGWRIAHRVEETLWWDNPMPGLPATPFPVPDDAFS